ncbi:MAG: preprotein translocase YidC [Ignavibacteriae bacterium HGW-Ignavibacteriae-3]|nr:MAG: preprotein translocase YidC [Ignavibacteriae bacterium HGW-Ignavibacteriae-3]
MDKNTSIAFILIGVILVTWLYFNSPAPQEPQKKITDTTAVETKDSVSIIDLPKVKEETKVPEESALFGAKTLEEKIITIETDLVKIELTSRGAKVRRYFLKQYKTWYHNDVKDTNFFNQHVQLVNTQKDGGDLNIIFVTKDGKRVNTSSIDFTSNANNYYYKISGEDSLSIDYTFITAEGKAIKKNFRFFGNDYASKIDIVLEKMDEVISSYRYDIEWTGGLNFAEENSVDEANHTSASAYSGDEQVIIDATSVGEKVEKDINGRVDWVATRNKYFTMILSPDSPSSEGGAYMVGNHYKIKQDVREIYSTSLKIPFKNEKYQKDSFTLYLGPVDYAVLKSYDRNFQTVFDFGSFFGLKFIIRPISEFILLPLFKFLHSFISNFGIVIILFSIIIKIALHPLTRQSMNSMKKMQMLQPKITELKEKHKDNAQKVQQETMKLYSTYGINPMGGCLPMLLQMPILIALWSLFNVAIELRQAPFMLWMTNLSSPDIIYRLPFKIPLFDVDIISGLALMMGITMFIQQKMTVKDPSQKALVYLMPVMMTVMFMSFPSGLNLYYFMFNLLSIGQQYYINHKHDGVELVPVANPNKKKGYMARMMEAAEKQALAQKKANQKKR